MHDNNQLHLKVPKIDTLQTDIRYDNHDVSVLTRVNKNAE